MQTGAAGVRWWLWPNVLALDAPAVAVIWQRFLGDAFGVDVPLAASVVLAFVVWGIYLVDRRLDGVQAATNQPRHHFAKQHATLVSVLAAFAFLTAAALAVTLPLAYLAAGAIIALLVVGYLALVHLVKAPLDGGKELLVGVLFAAGVSIPLIASDAAPQSWLPAVVGFGLLCWLNCRLIERWEAAADHHAIREVLLNVSVVICALLCRPWVEAALLVSALSLYMLELLRSRIISRCAPALADATLLTPLVGWWFL